MERQTISQIVDSIMSLEEGSRITLLAPKIRRKKGEHKDVFETARKSGFVRIRVNGEIRMLDETDNLNLNKNKWHYIELVVDRLIVRPETELARVAESVETCLREGEGVVEVLRESSEGGDSEDAGVLRAVRLRQVQPSACRRSSRAHFSFNSPHGACSECTGLGYKLAVDPELVIPNKGLSLSQGAITPWVRVGTSGAWYISLMESVAEANGFSAKVPVQELDPEHVDLILYGNGTQKVTVSHRTHRGRTYSWDTNFEGVIPQPGAALQDHRIRLRPIADRAIYVGPPLPLLQRQAAAARGPGGARLRAGHHGRMRQEHRRRRRVGGVDRPRLGIQPEWRRGTPLTLTLSQREREWKCWRVLGRTDTGTEGATVRETDGSPHSKNETAAPQVLSTRDKTIANQVLKEIDGRLKFLMGIGLDYVTMDRTAQTLSGGEAQRVRLATQIGSGLTGVLYVCDGADGGASPPRRPAADQHADPAARHGQHGAGGGARRGHDALRRLHRRPRTSRRRARRAGRSNRNGGGD